MKTVRTSTLLLVCVSSLCITIANGQFAGASHAQPELLSDTSVIVAGEPFTVALSFEIDPGWHLYWKNPGDSGMPPSVKWTLPEGFTAGELKFPAPKVLETKAGTNYIYEDRVALLVTITPPASLVDGQRVEITGGLKWLECDAEICVPAKQSLSLSVIAGKKTAAQHTSEFGKWEAEIKAGESYTPPAEK